MVGPRHIVLAIVVLTITQVVSGCHDGHRSLGPSGPSAVPKGDPAGTGVTFVQGFVQDTAFRPLAGVRVEVIDGPQAGSSATSDAKGEFVLSGTFDDLTRFRATKESYATSTEPLGPGQRIRFVLAVLAPSAPIAGDYTLTLAADPACAGLPDDMRTRSYTARIIPDSNPGHPANTSFNLIAGGASFLEGHGGLPIGVAGNVVTFLLDDDLPYLVEEIAANKFLAFYGRATVEAASGSTLSTYFDGDIRYCEQPLPIRDVVELCDRPLGQVSCRSRQHQLTLTQR
jgi:hypothetical protein